MISADQILTFGFASLLIVVVPGPSVLFVVGKALAHGRRTALAAAAGNDLGTLVLASTVALGFGSAAERSAVVFTGIKLAGATYLVFLGTRTFLNRNAHFAVEQGSGPHGRRRACLDGFLVGVANPKTLIFLGAVLPQFTDPAQGQASTQMLILGVLFTLIAFTTDTMWSLVANTARTWLGRSPRRLAMIGGAGGLAMIGLGVSVAATGHSP